MKRCELTYGEIFNIRNNNDTLIIRERENCINPFVFRIIRERENCINPFVFRISGGDSYNYFSKGFKTFEEAKAEKEKLIEDQTEIIFVVLKNADFCEGRGPMNIHKLFSCPELASKYIMSQEGIYGSKQYEENRCGVSIHNTFYSIHCYNGYEIKEMEIDV